MIKKEKIIPLDFIKKEIRENFLLQKLFIVLFVKEAFYKKRKICAKTLFWSAESSRMNLSY